MPKEIYNINGQLIAKENAGLPAFSWGIQNGYGLIETMICEDNHLPLLQQHIARLFAGMSLLGFHTPQYFTPDKLKAEILKTVRANQAHRLARVRLQIYTADDDGFSASRLCPGFLITCQSVPSSFLDFNHEGWHIGLSKNLVLSIDHLSALKHTSNLIYKQAQRQARVRNWNDCLLPNAHGRWVESSMANLFWVKNGVVATPPLCEGAIAGIMRQHLLKLLPRKGYELIEKNCNTEDLFEADEIFLTNALRRIIPVKRFEDLWHDFDYTYSIHELLTEPDWHLT